MPKFDLTRGVRKEHVTGAEPHEAYAICQKTVEGFGEQGYALTFIEEQPPWAFKAHLTGEGGTDLVADVALTDQGDTTRVELQLSGHLFLGGVLGRMVDRDVIERQASNKLDELLAQHFKHAPRRRQAPSSLLPEPAQADTSVPLAPSVAVPTRSVLPTTQAAPAVDVVDARAATVIAANTQGAPEPTPAPHRTGAVVGSAAAALGGHEDLVDAVLDGRRSASDDEARRALCNELVSRCAVAAGAAAVQPSPFVDVGLFHPVQVRLLRALGHLFGERVDRAEAGHQLSAMGASVVEQSALLPSGDARWVDTVATAYALTAAAGEAAIALATGSEPGTEGLAASFESAFERVRSEKLAAARPVESLGDRLGQLHEAFDADLLSEEEYTRLKERVLTSF